MEKGKTAVVICLIICFTVVGMLSSTWGLHLNDDNAAVTLEGVTAVEGHNLVFTLTLNSQVQDGFDVSLIFVDDTATGGNVDYDSSPQTVSFLGNTVGEIQQVTVSTVADDIVESPETFDVRLSTTNVAVDVSNIAIGTIFNDNSVAVTEENVTANEGDNPAFTVISVNDLILEIDETFDVALGESNSLVGYPDTAVSTIANGDNMGSANSSPIIHNIEVSGDAIPLQIANFPERPRPLMEIGDPLLETGPISKGFYLPSGAVWQPSVILFGTYRTAMQFFYDGDEHNSEWANRMDLFANLSLTPSERILFGTRILDQDGRFSGYTFKSRNRNSGFENEFNIDLRTLFFEGDFGELFPFLDRRDQYGFDVGFSVGRQPIIFQDGLLINDEIDALGITKINLRFPTAVNHRSTILFAWNDINRTNLTQDDDNGKLFGWFNEIDWRKSTVEFDSIYLDANADTGRGVFLGLGSTQILGNFNTTFRVLGSVREGDKTPHNRAGTLLFSEVSRTLVASENLLYLNSFLGIDHYRSASRAPTVGGPLARTGILFESVGLGQYPSPLNNDADEAFGGAIGYQMFLSGTRKQLVLELGARYAMDNKDQRAFGVGSRYQFAVGNRGIIRLDGFVVYDEDRDIILPPPDGYKFGARLELAIKF